MRCAPCAVNRAQEPHPDCLLVGSSHVTALIYMKTKREGEGPSLLSVMNLQRTCQASLEVAVDFHQAQPLKAQRGRQQGLIEVAVGALHIPATGGPERL